MEDQKERLKALKKYHRAFLSHKAVLDESANRGVISRFPAYELHETVLAAKQELGDLVPALDLDRFCNNTGSNDPYYSVDGLRGYIARVVSAIAVEAEGEAKVDQFERKEFHYIQDKKIRAILSRDYFELEKARFMGCWKSVIILAGGSIEAILLDVLKANESAARSSSKAPQNKPSIEQWGMEELVNVAEDLKLISGGLGKLSHGIRAYRNLVHPGNEVRNRLNPSEHEAEIARSSLKMLDQDLGGQY